MRTDNKSRVAYIESALAFGVKPDTIKMKLTEYPHLLTYDEAQAEIEKVLADAKGRVVGHVSTLREVNPASLLAQQGVPPERNYTPSKLNRSAVKEFALEVSNKKKNGKFERVGKDFVEWTEAELENIIQGICRNPHSEDDLGSTVEMLNWKQVGPRVRQVLNRAIRRAVFSRVKNHPSTGKTLK